MAVYIKYTDGTCHTANTIYIWNTLHWKMHAEKLQMDVLHCTVGSHSLLSWSLCIWATAVLSLADVTDWLFNSPKTNESVYWRICSEFSPKGHKSTCVFSVLTVQACSLVKRLLSFFPSFYLFILCVFHIMNLHPIHFPILSYPPSALATSPPPLK